MIIVIVNAIRISTSNSACSARKASFISASTAVTVASSPGLMALTPFGKLTAIVT